MAIDYKVLYHYICLFLSEIGRNPDWISAQEWEQVAKAIARVVGDGIDDHKVLSSDTDTTTPGGLLQKLLAGTGISLQETLDGSVNKVRITNTAPDDHKVISSDTDITNPGGLLQKLSEGLGITLTEVNEGGVNKIKVTSVNTHTHSAGTGISVDGIDIAGIPNVRITNTLPETYKVDVTAIDNPGYLDQKIVVGPGLNKQVIGSPFEQVYITLDPQTTDPTSGGSLYTCRTVTIGTPTTSTTPNVVDTDSISYTLNYNDSRLNYHGAKVDIPLIHFNNDPKMIVTGVRMTVNTPFLGPSITEFKVRLDLDSFFEWDSVNGYGTGIFSSPIPSSNCESLTSDVPLVDIASVSPGTVYESIVNFKQEFSDGTIAPFDVNPLWIIIEANSSVDGLSQGSLTVEVFYEQRDVVSLQRFDGTYLKAFTSSTSTTATYPLITSSAGNPTLEPPTSWISPLVGRKLTHLISTVGVPFIIWNDEGTGLRPGASITYTVKDVLGNTIIPETDCTYYEGAPRFAAVTTGVLNIDFQTAPLQVTFKITGGTFENLGNGHIIFDPLYETTSVPAPTVNGYELLTASQLVPEGADTNMVSIDANIATPGEVSIVLSFPTLVGTPGVTTLPAGTWTFDVYGYVDGTSLGVTNSWRVKMSVWRDGQPGPDAPFLTATSGQVSNTIPQVTTFTANQASPIVVTANDRLVAVYYGVTTGSVLRTFTLVYNDINRLNRIITPIAFMGGTGTIDHWSTTNRDRLESHPASAIAPVTTNFNNNLSVADDTVQKALDTLDNITIHGGTGTTNYLAKWISSTALGDSGVTDNGTSITILGSRVLDLAGSTSGVVTIKPAATTDTWVLTLPTNVGTSDYVLKTNGSGVTSWASISSLGGVLTTRTILTVNGLQGGGDLSTDRTLSPVYGTAVNTVCQGNDSRLSDDRVAYALRNLTGIVYVSGSAAPSSGQVLRALGSTTAAWQTITPADIGALPAANINVSPNYLAKGGASAGTLVNSQIVDDGISPVYTAADFGTGDAFVYSTKTTVPATANYTAEIGAFTLVNGGGVFDLFLTVASPGFSQSKRYLVPWRYGSTFGSGWARLIPIFSSGPYDGNDVDIDVTYAGFGNVAKFRVRRISGPYSGEVRVLIVKHGTSTSDVWTPMSGTGTDSAPTEIYPSTLNAGAVRIAGSTSGTVTHGVAATTETYSLLAPSTAPGANQAIVYPAGGGQGTWVTVGSGITGSGTTGTLSKWTSPSALGNSTLTESGSSLETGSTFWTYSTLTSGIASGTNGKLILNGSTSGAVSITTSATAGTWTLTLPTSAGTNNYVLSTNGSGVTSWNSIATLGGITGSGTVNYIPRWTPSGSVLGNSGITDDGNATVEVLSTRTFTIIGGQLKSGVNGTAGGTLQLRGSTSGTVTVQTAAAAGTWSLTLPTSAGTDGYVLKTNGSGVTSWISVVTGSGTTNYIPRWSSSTVLTNSAIADDGSNVYSSRSIAVTGAVSATTTLTGANFNTVTGGNCWAGYYSSANSSYTTVGGTHNVVMGNGISCGTSTSYNILLGENSSAGNSSNHCIGLEGQFAASVSTSVAIHTTSAVDSSYTMKIGYKNKIVINNSSDSNWLFMATPMSSYTGVTRATTNESWLPIACKPDLFNFGCLCVGSANCWGLQPVYFQVWS